MAALFDQLPQASLFGAQPAAPAAGTGMPVSNADRPNAFSSGLQQGLYGLATSFGGAAAGLEKIAAGGAGLVGATGVQQSLNQSAENTLSKVRDYQAAADAVSRPDIERDGWTGGGLAGLGRKLAYTAGEMIPQAAAVVGGAALAPVVLPEAGLAGVVGEGTGAASTAARALLGPQVLGGAAVTIPQSFGEQVNAQDKNGGVTAGGAVRALAQSVPVGLAQAVVPAEGAGASVLTRTLGAGSDSVLARTGGRAIQDAAVMAVGSGAQQAANDSFDPNLTVGQRVQNIVSTAVEGAVTGGLLGGTFGGVEALRERLGNRGQISTTSSTDDLDQATKTALDPEPPAPAPAGDAVQPEAPQATPDVATAQEPQQNFTEQFIQQLQDQGVLRMSKGASSEALRDFARQSDAADLRDLYEEIERVDSTSPLAQTLGADKASSPFTKLANHLGVGETDLDQKIADLANNPDAANAKAIMFRGGLRDAVLERRGTTPAEPEPAAPAPVEPADVAQPAVQPPADAPAAEPATSSGVSTDLGTPADPVAYAAHIADINQRFPSIFDNLDAVTPELAERRAADATTQQLADFRGAYGDDAQRAIDLSRQLERASTDTTIERLQKQIDALDQKHGVDENSDAYRKTFGVQYPDEAMPDFWRDVRSTLNDNAATDVTDLPASVRQMMRDLPTTNDPSQMTQAQKVNVVGLNDALRRLVDSGMTEREALEQAFEAGRQRDGRAAAELFQSDFQRYLDLRGDRGQEPAPAPVPALPEPTSDQSDQAFREPIPAQEAVGAGPGDGAQDGGGDEGSGQAAGADVAPAAAQEAVPGSASAAPEGLKRPAAPPSEQFGPYRLMPEGDPDTPAWLPDMQRTADALSRQFGLKLAPKIWAMRGNPDPTRVTFGVTSQGGHLALLNTMDRQQAINTMLHEFGHQVEFQKVRSAPPNVQSALQRAFEKDRVKNGAKTFGETAPLSLPEMFHDQPGDYITNDFKEWFAEQTSRWITTRRAPTGVVDTFFKGIADVWRSIYQRITGHVPLNAEVDRFMKGLWRGDANVDPPGGPDLSSGAGAGRQGAQAAQDAATNRALAPQPSGPVTPEGAAQRQVKTRAASDVLAAPPSARTAAADQTMRRQIRKRTALVDTPTGDQVPTGAIGGDETEIPQAREPLTDVPPRAGDVKPTVVYTALGDASAPVDVAGRVAKLNDKLRPGAPKVQVVSSLDELPSATRARLNGLDPRTSAIYDGKNIFVRADQVGSRADLEQALSHTAFSHAGTGESPARPFEAAMARLWDRVVGEGGRSTLPDYWPGFVADRIALTPFSKARAMSEILANGSRDPKVSGVVLAARQAIANNMRRAGLTDFASRVLRMSPDDLAGWIDAGRQAMAARPEGEQLDMLKGASDPRTVLHDSAPTEELAPFGARVSRQQRDVQGVQGIASAILDHTGRLLKSDAGQAIRGAGRTVLENLSPAVGIVEHAARNGLEPLRRAFSITTELENPGRVRLDQVSKANEQAHRDLRYLDKAQYDRLGQVMADSTLANVDPRRPWAEHTWFDSLDPTERAAKKAEYDRVQGEYNKLAQPGKGGKTTNGQQIFDTHATLGQHQWYMNRSSHLWTVMRDFAGFDQGVDPVKRYSGNDPTHVDAAGRNLANDYHGNSETSHAFSKAYYEDLVGRARDFYNTESIRPPNLGAPEFVELGRLLKTYDEAHEGQIQQGPYFHLGRTGDFAVGFTVKPEIDAEGKPTGRPDPAAFGALRDGYAKDFGDVNFSTASGIPTVFARFSNIDRANQFANMVREGGALREHIDPEHTVYAGSLEHAHEFDGVVPFLDSQITKLAQQFDADISKLPQGDPRRDDLERGKQRALANVRATIMDLVGDNTTRGLDARRKGTQGFGDMLDAQVSAAGINARAASTNIYRQAKALEVSKARDAIVKVENSGAKDAATRAIAMQRILNAYLSREDAANVRISSSFGQAITRGLHTYTLGFSPGYFFMQLAQVPTLTFPELAKAHGLANTGVALVRALGSTGKVLASMARNGHLFHGGITEHILAGAGLSPEMQRYVIGLVNRDKIELGSYSHVNSGVNLGTMDRVQKMMHYANSSALMAEVAARLVSGIAAKHLYDSAKPEVRTSLDRRHGDAVGYGGSVIDNSMFQWGSYNTPKLFTAGGALGQAGPVLSKFHGFAPRLAEKVIRESLDGFTRRLEDPAERVEARRFMFAHLAAVTAMTGTLGLPAASWVGAVATRLSGLFNQGQSFDFEAHYRDFLASVFGKDMGEVISRGLPRYLGVDLANLGDSELLPFTRLLEDRRKLEDAVPAYLANAWGSGPGAALNLALAAREMSEGRVSEALARGLPNAFRNLARAYRVGEYGAMTSTGEKLPVSNSVGSIFATALGYEPGDVAEERERADAVRGLQDDRQYARGNLTRDYLLAVRKGDQSGINDAVAAAQRFDQNNPGAFITPGLGAALRTQLTNEAYAQQFGATGLKPRDLAGRGLVQF